MKTLFAVLHCYFVGGWKLPTEAQGKELKKGFSGGASVQCHEAALK